jgi:TolB-like protein
MHSEQLTSPEMVHTQLERILGSNTFKEAERLKKFLQFIAEQTLHGNEDQLKQYTIATSAFDRGDEFDPQKDPIVRIQAARLRERLNKYYQTEGKKDPLLIIIPKGSYVPIFSRQGKFEDNYVHNDLPQTTEPSIAVFPFKNLTGKESLQYIADGFTEELIITLSSYKYVTVIRAFNKTEDPLNSTDNRTFNQIEFLLNGSIRFNREKIKVIVTLSDANSDEVIWGNEFFETYGLEKMIDIQETVARKVAACIADVYGGVIPKKRYKENKESHYKNIETYDAILHFYHYKRNPIASEYNKVIEKVNMIVEKYPASGPAWSILGNLTIDNYALGFEEDPGLLDQALEYTKKGVYFDPDNLMTRTYLAYAYLIGNQLEACIQQAQFAKSLNPKSPNFIGALGWGTALAGEWEQGITDIELSYTLNLDYPKWYHLAPSLYYLKEHKFEAAMDEAMKFDSPGLFWDPLVKTFTYALAGKQKEAENSLENLLLLKPDFPQKSSFYIGMYVKFDDLRQLIYKGLEKAGFPLRQFGNL